MFSNLNGYIVDMKNSEFTKKQNLQNMHMFTEDQINFQLVGNKYNQ